MFPFSPRLISVTALLYGIRYYIISVYMYPEDANRKIGLSAEVISCIGGDFNATSTAACTFTRLRGNKPVPEGSFINKNGHRLHDFVKNHDLAIMNTFWRTKKCQMDTWRHTSGFMKTVDYILCDGLTSSWGTNCRVRSSYDFQSDHFL